MLSMQGNAGFLKKIHFENLEEISSVCIHKLGNCGIFSWKIGKRFLDGWHEIENKPHLCQNQALALKSKRT